MPENQVPQAFGCRKVTIQLTNGDKYRLALSRSLFADRKQRHIPLGGGKDLESLRYAQSRQIQAQQAIDSKTFDPTLARYQSWNRDKSDVYTVESATVLTLGTLWEGWCQYKSPLLAPSTIKLKYRGTYQATIVRFGDRQPVDSATAVRFRNYLIENLNSQDTVNLLRELDNACRRLLNLNISSLKSNPFYEMSKTIKNARNLNKESRTADAILEENEGTVSYTEKEVHVVTNYFKIKYPEYYLFVCFRFLTGMRIGESSEIRWGDVTSDFTKIVISRSYDSETDTIKSTKTGKTRTFHCSESLMNLLENYYNNLSEIERDNNQLIFRNKGGGNIKRRTYAAIWDKALRALVEQKQLSKRLAPKNTRHTFATRARQAGYDREAVARQLGHSAAVEDRNYVDRSDDGALEF